MSDISFPSTIEGTLNVQTDLLIDIYSWQQIIINRLAKLEAEKEDADFVEVMEEWDKQRLKIRSSVIEQIYAKHGPDLSNELMG